MKKRVHFSNKVIYHDYPLNKKMAINPSHSPPPGNKLKSILKKNRTVRQKPNASYFTDTTVNAYRPPRIVRQVLYTTFRRYQF